jgi:pyruvate/2-oxoglutarate dehydrogenase complex dihydrolipoamide dehydrogenase (E3) component
LKCAPGRRIPAVGAATGDADAAVNRAAQVSTALGSLLFRRTSRHYPALAVRHAPSIPAIAECGLREDDLGSGARSKHRFYRIRLPEDGMSGAIKVITNARGKLLGVSIVAARPLDLLPVFQLAMAQGLGIADLAGLPLPSAAHAAAIGDLARLGLREKLFSPATGRLVRLLRVLG